MCRFRVAHTFYFVLCFPLACAPRALRGAFRTSPTLHLGGRGKPLIPRVDKHIDSSDRLCFTGRYLLLREHLAGDLTLCLVRHKIHPSPNTSPWLIIANVKKS